MSVARKPTSGRWAKTAAIAVGLAASWAAPLFAQPVGYPTPAGPAPNVAPAGMQVYDLPAPSEDALWKPSPGYAAPPMVAPSPEIAVDDCGCGVPLLPEDEALYEQMLKAGCGPLEPCDPPANLSELGLGAEFVPYAMFEIDGARPRNQIRLRLDAAYDWEFPDRAEIFYGRSGGLGVGPTGIDSYVNYQDYRIYMEAGGDKISAFTEIPIRSIDPDVNPNTTGLGDLQAGTKVMLLDTPRLKGTMIMRFYTPTGYFRRGLGTGHLSMEPGGLFQYQLSCTTFLHGELKYFFPLPGDPEFAGQYIRYGFGVSHLLYEKPTTDFAIIPTLEVVGFSVLDGRKTAPNGDVIDVDPEAILNVHPGVRFLLSAQTDFGISGGFKVTEQHFFSEMLRADFRIFY